MLKRAEQKSGDDRFRPVEVLNPQGRADLLLVCDHASNAVPEAYDRLGLPPSEFHRHIAYDIGAAGVTRHLASRFDAPAVLAGFSRLLVDPNRGHDDPTIVMKLSDGAVIPANRLIDRSNDRAEFERRIESYWRPYDDAVAHQIDRAFAEGAVPLVVSIHSFTPVFKGRKRPWHIGVLWDKDDRFAKKLLGALETVEGLCVGDNQPYLGALKGDCLYRHATRNGLAHGLIEIRQDLIATPAGEREWSNRLASVIDDLLGLPELHEVRHMGSRTDERL